MRFYHREDKWTIYDGSVKGKRFYVTWEGSGTGATYTLKEAMDYFDRGVWTKVNVFDDYYKKLNETNKC